MKRLMIGLVVMTLLLIGCSGGNAADKKIEEINERLKTDANIYILENRLAEMTNEPLKDFTNTINLLRWVAQNSDDEYEKEMNNKLADLLEKDDLEGVKQFYKELGGELKKDKTKDETPSEESSLETWKVDNDKKFGVMSLHTANIFFDAGFEVGLEDRERIAEMISGNLVYMDRENRSDFEAMSDLIVENNVNEAKEIFETLKLKYISDDKMGLFDKLGEYTSQEELSAAIDEILK